MSLFSSRVGQCLAEPFAATDVELSREDDHTVRVRVPSGYHAHPADQLLRRSEDPLPMGARVDLPGMSAEVAGHTPSGHVETVLFRFDLPLDDPSFLCLARRDRELQAIRPPAAGERLLLPVTF